jgi:hypothetical protein
MRTPPPGYAATDSRESCDSKTLLSSQHVTSLHNTLSPLLGESWFCRQIPDAAPQLPDSVSGASSSVSALQQRMTTQVSTTTAPLSYPARPALAARGIADVPVAPAHLGPVHYGHPIAVLSGLALTARDRRASADGAASRSRAAV